MKVAEAEDHKGVAVPCAIFFFCPFPKTEEYYSPKTP